MKRLIGVLVVLAARCAPVSDPLVVNQASRFKITDSSTHKKYEVWDGRWYTQNITYYTDKNFLVGDTLLLVRKVDYDAMMRVIHQIRQQQLKNAGKKAGVKK